MRHILRALFVAALLLTSTILTTEGCAKTPNIVTAQGKAAYTADQIVQRIAEFQNAVIAAADAGKMRVADARTIVTWVSGDVNATPPRFGLVQAIRAAPDGGWKIVALQEWPAIKPLLADNATLAPWADLVEALIGGR